MYRIEIDRFRSVVDSQVKLNMARCAHLPVYSLSELERGSVAICAAGPSLLSEMEMIRSLYKMGVPICAVKGVASVLIEHGIIPTYAVFMDPQESQARFLQDPHRDVQYLMCSQTHPDVMKLLDGFNVLIWHGQCEDYVQELVNQSGVAVPFIHGPTTGVAALNLMRSMGYKPLNLFGFDCSHQDSVTHVYEKADVSPMKVWIGGKSFITSLPMVDQHNDLVRLCSQTDIGARVYGDGAFQHSVRMMARPNAIPEDFLMLIDCPIDNKFENAKILLEPIKVEAA